MLMPLMVATVLHFSSLLAYATAMHLVVRVMVRVIRSGSNGCGRAAAYTCSTARRSPRPL